jgi:hypothetical protein
LQLFVAESCGLLFSAGDELQPIHYVHFAGYLVVGYFFFSEDVVNTTDLTLQLQN